MRQRPLFLAVEAAHVNDVRAVVMRVWKGSYQQKLLLSRNSRRLRKERFRHDRWIEKGVRPRNEKNGDHRPVKAASSPLRRRISEFTFSIRPPNRRKKGGPIENDHSPCSALSLHYAHGRLSRGAGSGREGKEKLATATFAGGCFWCMEPAFDKLKGVISVMPGYTAGPRRIPPTKRCRRALRGTPSRCRSPTTVQRWPSDLLTVFWHNIDPTVKDRQFCDVGNQYRSAIFYHDEEQKKVAEASKKALEESKRSTALLYRDSPGLDILSGRRYHRQYYKKNPVRYKFYRWNCGRDSRLKEVWGESAGAHE